VFEFRNPQSAIRNWFDLGPWPLDPLRLGAALGCIGLLVHSLVDFNLHIPANAAWFAFCAGLAIARGEGS